MNVNANMSNDMMQVKSVGLVFASLMVAMVIGSLDQTIVSTALPTIVGELDGVDHMLWITTSYVLASTIVMPVYGKVGDLVGRKAQFVGALVFFLIGSVVCGAATSMAALIAGRSVQGLGGGGLMVLSQAIVADVVPPRKRAIYLNAMGIAWALPMLVGPLLGGLFTDHLSWRWAFWINIPLGLLSIIVCAFFLPKYKMVKKGQVGRTLTSFDFSGTILIGISVAGAIFTSSLVSLLSERLAPLGGAQVLGVDANSLTPAIVRALPSDVQATVAGVYNDAQIPLFMLMVPMIVIAGVLIFLLHKTPLAETQEDSGKMSACHEGQSEQTA